MAPSLCLSSWAADMPPAPAASHPPGWRPSSATPGRGLPGPPPPRLMACPAEGEGMGAWRNPSLGQGWAAAVLTWTPEGPLCPLGTLSALLAKDLPQSPGVQPATCKPQTRDRGVGPQPAVTQGYLSAQPLLPTAGLVSGSPRLAQHPS